MNWAYLIAKTAHKKLVSTFFNVYLKLCFDKFVIDGANCSKTGTNFPKNKAVTGKTPLFVIGPFCSRHSIYLNIGFRQSR